MYNELTNLLPQERQDAFVRDYFLRIGVVAALLITVITIAATALLLPAYVLLTGSAHSKVAHLADIRSTFSSVDEAALAARLTTLANAASTLTTLAGAPTVSTSIRSALSISRPGVTLSSVVYAPSTSKAGGTLVISGTAATRDALRQYQLALSGAPFALSADLPVSVYAKDFNIAFSIRVALAP